MNNPKYANQINSAKAKVESLNLNDYDFKNEESRHKFLEDLNKSYHSDNGLSDTSLSGGANGTCLFFAAVVAVALWNSVAAVNVAVVLNVIGGVFAAVKTYDNVWSGGGTRSKEELEPYRTFNMDLLVAQVGSLK